MRTVAHNHVLHLALWCAAALNAVGPSSAQRPEETVPFRFDQDHLSQSDLHAALGALCPGDVVTTPQSSGCRVCPADTTSPGGKIESIVEYTLRGHFLAPLSDDVIVVLNGCAPHAGGDRDAILVTRGAGVWSSKGRVGAFGRCRKIVNAKGVDGLLCLTDYTQHGNTTYWLSFGYVGAVKVTKLDETHDLRELVDERSQQLLEVSDYREEACANAVRGITDIVPVSKIRAIDVEQFNGRTTLRVNVTCSRGTLTARWRKGCSTYELPPGEIRLDATPRAFDLRYTFDGHLFSLETSSKSHKRQLDACAALPR